MDVEGKSKAKVESKVVEGVDSYDDVLARSVVFLFEFVPVDSHEDHRHEYGGQVQKQEAPVS
jgi:hypothetical protein